jgi:hypothetical protein
MADETFEDRLVAEYDQLRERISKADDFMAGPMFSGLDDHGRFMLQAQVGAMKLYAGILGARVGYYVETAG